MTVIKKEQVNLKGLSKVALERYVDSLGEKKYRAQQIYEWLYARSAESFDEMSNLSKAFRECLSEKARIGKLELVAKQKSTKDGSMKFLFQLEDGQRIESVLMAEGRRTILCVSTQVGCALDCKFCATGTMGFLRNLTAGEMVDQLLQAQNFSGVRVSNLVFMGMGEPFHNYDHVMTAGEILSSEDGPNLGSRHIVVSTSGLVPKIYRFADEMRRFKLAVSLNATTDEVRARIMPITKKWSIHELLKAVRYYVEKKAEPVTFEYVLLKDINDSENDAARLRSLVDGISCRINLIPYNAAVGEYSRSPADRIDAFYKRLAGIGSPVTIRWSKGDDIAAGCGQLATRVMS